MQEKVWILGPCSIEDDDLFINTMNIISDIMGQKDWYMKASFDKANRTSISGSRGPGLEYSINVWSGIKKTYPNVKLITDVHEVSQIEKLVGVVDAIQIPAFLCRQTDLIIECAKNFNIINIKKGQWIGPNNLIISIDKIKNTNDKCEAWICDRGSNFGYHDLFVNYGIVDQLKKYYDRVLLDCTHATQRSREVYGVQGDRALAERYFITADAFNYDGVFAEVHPNPKNAVSDGDCQLELFKLEELVEKADKIREVVCKT